MLRILRARPPHQKEKPAIKFSNLVIVNRLDVLKEELAALVEGEESTDQRA